MGLAVKRFALKCLLLMWLSAIAADALAARGPDRAGVAVPGGLELFRASGRLGIRPVRWPSAR